MEEPKYDSKKCVEVVSNFLPSKMRKKLGQDKIALMLALSYRFLAQSEEEVLKNPAEPKRYPDPGEAEKYIVKQCSERGIKVSLKEAQYVLDGEFFYQCQKGTVKLEPKGLKINGRQEINFKNL